jgi:hypothetical protein
MTTQDTESTPGQRTDIFTAALGIVLVPVLCGAACFAFPYSIALRWYREHREHSFRLLMKSQGRLVSWQEFLRTMQTAGGTCIEERFSPKGPVRYWWTPESVSLESPHRIVDWFTMRKGRESEPFIYWCRRRYTGADEGSAILVDTTLVPRNQIYIVWAECRSEASKARWVEVAPPEIVPHGPWQQSVSTNH